MNVTLLYFDECPYWKITDGTHASSSPRSRASRSAISALTRPKQPRDSGIGGPSILIEGTDPFASVRSLLTGI
jgi:hypothetical protein